MLRREDRPAEPAGPPQAAAATHRGRPKLAIGEARLGFLDEPRSAVGVRVAEGDPPATVRAVVIDNAAFLVHLPGSQLAAGALPAAKPAAVVERVDHIMRSADAALARHARLRWQSKHGNLQRDATPTPEVPICDNFPYTLVIRRKIGGHE
jgi:hypothetical protein